MIFILELRISKLFTQFEHENEGEGVGAVTKCFVK